VQLTLPTKTNSPGLLILEHGDLAGERFQIRARVCGNPVCECQIVTLFCEPEQPDAPNPAPPIGLDFNVERRDVTCGNQSAARLAGKALAGAVAREMDAAAWRDLNRFYLALKQHYTETADLNEVEAKFPPEAASGSMVGYYEILPFARPVEVRRNGRLWLLDDEYCVRPNCTCASAAMGFLELQKMGEPESELASTASAVISFDYGSGRHEILQESADQSLEGEDLLTALKEVQPDLKAFFARRHAALRQMYLRYSERDEERRRTLAKIGRNDLCTCGSGKKFKRCCGASGTKRLG
jgi:hypothetical protein